MARSDCKKTPGWDPSFGSTGPDAFPAYCSEHACEYTDADGALGLCQKQRSEASGNTGNLCRQHKNLVDKAAEAEAKQKAQESKDMKKRSDLAAKNHRKEEQEQAAAKIEVPSTNWKFTVTTPDETIAAALVR